MVKARVSRSLAHRFNPLAQPEEEVCETDLVTRLRSPDDSEREVACISAGTIRQSSDPTPIIKALLERISDPNGQVRLAALQACEALSDVFHQHLLAAGIVNLVEHVLKGFFTLETTMFESEVERLTDVMVASAALDVLSSLCEYSSTLLSKLTDQLFLSHLLQYLSAGVDRQKLIGPIISLLQVLSEENHAFLSAVPASFPSQLLSLSIQLQANQMREQAAIAATLCNYYLLRNDANAVRENVVPTVLRLVAHNLWQELIENVIPVVTSNTAHVSLWRDASIAVEEALQLMANLLYTEEEDQASEFFTSIVSRSTVQLLMTIALGIPVEQITALSDVFEASLQSSILSVQSTAINVLKNIVLSGAQFITAEEGIAITNQFFALCTAWSEAREEVMAKETVDTLVAGALSLVQVTVKRLNLEVKVEWVPVILQIARWTNVEVATNAVAVLAGLGRTRHSVEVNAEVCSFLVSTCQSKCLPLLNEVLNAFFDIYSDETYDSILQTQGVIHLMIQGLPVFRAMVEREESEDLRENAELTVTNLRDFIAYKQQHMQ